MLLRQLQHSHFLANILPKLSYLGVILHVNNTIDQDFILRCISKFLKNGMEKGIYKHKKFYTPFDNRSF